MSAWKTKSNHENTKINSRVGEFKLKTLVIPAKAGHAVKRQRYPASGQLNALEPRLRGDDVKKLPDPRINWVSSWFRTLSYGYCVRVKRFRDYIPL